MHNETYANLNKFKLICSEMNLCMNIILIKNYFDNLQQ